MQSDEAAAWEAEKEAESQRLKRHQRVLDKQSRALLKLPNRKERSEVSTRHSIKASRHIAKGNEDVLLTAKLFSMPCNLTCHGTCCCKIVESALVWSGLQMLLCLNVKNVIHLISYVRWKRWRLSWSKSARQAMPRMLVISLLSSGCDRSWLNSR